MTSPRVSIVLPTYNRAEYLPQALESCIAQTFTDWELIIVDDASTDDTPHIIESYCTRDARIHAVRHNTNRRLPSALNTGFAAARGQYFTWTSDDNLYRPAALVDMLAFIDAQDVDLVYAAYSVINRSGETVSRPCMRPLADLVFVNVIGACFLYKREVHMALGGYSTDLFLAEDYDFWLRASTAFRFGFLDKDLYLYRSHETSLYETRASEVKSAHAEALFRTLPRLQWMSPELARAAYANLVSLGVQRGDLNDARRYARLAARHRPLALIQCDMGLVARLLCPFWLQPVKSWFERVYWRRRARRVALALAELIERGERIVLLDVGALEPIDAPNAIVPFTEADGQYNGLPRDDDAASGELKRLREQGASFFAVAWPAFWCITYYKVFFGQISKQYPCVRNRDLIIFDLREAS